MVTSGGDERYNCAGVARPKNVFVTVAVSVDGVSQSDLPCVLPNVILCVTRSVKVIELLVVFGVVVVVVVVVGHAIDCLLMESPFYALLIMYTPRKCYYISHIQSDVFCLEQFPSENHPRAE